MKKIILAATLAALTFIPDISVRAQQITGEVVVPERGPEGRERVGVLACTIDGGIGLILGSSKSVNCTFRNRNTGNTESYTGVINKFGLDLGITGKQYMRWIVFGPQGSDNVEGFAGTYRGVSAGIGLVASFGANALIGGSESNFVLQPVSLEAGTGLNIAIGVAALKISRVN